MTASPQLHRGCLLWPVLNDETGKVDYWEVHPPCPENHLVQRPGQPPEKAPHLDCCHYAEPEDTAATLAEAKALTFWVARNHGILKALSGS